MAATPVRHPRCRRTFLSPRSRSAPPGSSHLPFSDFAAQKPFPRARLHRSPRRLRLLRTRRRSGFFPPWKFPATLRRDVSQPHRHGPPPRHHERRDLGDSARAGPNRPAISQPISSNAARFSTKIQPAHRSEHATEVELPFLQIRQPKLSFVPIALGTGQFEALRSTRDRFGGSCH